MPDSDCFFRGDDPLDLVFRLNDILALELSPVQPWPPLDARKAIFSRVPITWEQWVETWQKDQDGGASSAPFDAEVKLLPSSLQVSLTGP